MRRPPCRPPQRGPDGPTLHDHLRIDAGAVALGDLAGDGELDLAVTLPAAGAVELLTISRAGELARGHVVWRSDFPIGVVFADLDDDGALDLAAADRLDRRVHVSLGDGAGGWRSHHDWPVALEPTYLVARRGPTGPELAVTGADLSSLALIDPTTGDARISAFAPGGAAGWVAADIDGDGLDELLSGEAQLHEVDGFTADRVWTEDPGRETARFALVDLDGDDALELVAHDPDSAEFVVHVFDEPGLVEVSRIAGPPAIDGLVALGRELAWWSGPALGLLTVADGALTDADAPLLLADAIVDVVGDPDALHVATRGQSGAVWRVPRGDDGSLGEPAQVFTGGAVTGLVLAGPGDPWIAHADGVSRLGGVMVSPLRSLAAPTLLDLDGDHTRELVGCRDDGVFAVRGADGHPVRLAETRCSRVDACDLDADSTVELLVTSTNNAFSSAGLEVFTGAGDVWTSRGALVFGLQADQLALDCKNLSGWTGGGVGLARSRLRPGPALRGTTPQIAQTSVLGDLDGDGRDELLADDGRYLLHARPDDPTHAPPRLLPRPFTGRLVGLGEFDGAPGRELLVRVDPDDAPVSHDIWSLRDDTAVRTGNLAVSAWQAIGDFDGDGCDELITREGYDTFTLQRPDRHGRLTAVALDPELATARWLGAGDMDRDGRADLVLLGDDGRTFAFAVRLAHGDGFTPPQLWPTPLELFTEGSFTIGDYDQNGTHDLVYGDPLTAIIRLCPGNGRGGPAAPCRALQWDAGTSFSSSPIVGDFDGDGLTDLVVLRTALHRPAYQVLRGAGGGQFVITPPTPISTTGALRRARVGDDDLWLVLGYAAAELLPMEGR